MGGRGYAVPGAVLLGALVLGGCGDTAAGPAAQTEAATVTVTETATVTETVTATVTDPAAAAADPEDTASDQSDSATVPMGGEAEPTTAELPTMELTVLADGCAVERGEGDLPNLTWVVYDDLDVQVLGRNALGETRYRYFQPGTWTMVLQAWAGDRYAPVSDEVTITC